MTDKLVDFVNELDQDPKLQEEYKQNPKEVAERYKLEGEDLRILLENDMEAIKKRFEQEGIKASIRISHSQ